MMTPRMERLLRDRRANASTRVLGLYIAERSADWYSYHDMAADLHISPTTLRLSMRRLKELGYVEVMQRVEWNGPCGWRWVERTERIVEVDYAAD